MPGPALSKPIAPPAKKLWPERLNWFACMRVRRRGFDPSLVSRNRIELTAKRSAVIAALVSKDSRACQRASRGCCSGKQENVTAGQSADITDF